MSGTPSKRARTTRSNGSYGEDALAVGSSQKPTARRSPSPSPLHSNHKVAESTTPVVPVRQHEHHVPEFRIGLDFGTTTTTAAFADLRWPGKVHTVKRFPRNPSPKESRPYVPSEVAYPTKKSHVPGNRITTAVYNDKVCAGYIHGYEVHKFLGATYDTSSSENYIRISHLKTLLDTSKSTTEIRNRQLQKLNLLGKSAADVISDYLTVVFLHTKHEMTVRGHGYHSESLVEVVFTVPITWTPQTRDIMRQCVSDAMQRADFGCPGNISLPRLFMVHEAEAAATSVLRSGSSLSRGDTFVMLDCGGGTVDSGTFTIANENPLRLETQVTDPQGDSCGANQLNEIFFKKIYTDMKQETQREWHGHRLKSIIDAEAMGQFENYDKPNFEYGLAGKSIFRFHALQCAQSGPKTYTLPEKEMGDIFDQVLGRTSKIMVDQIIGANKKKVTVDKVVVVGGFSESSALRYYLIQEVRKLNDTHNLEVELIFSPNDAVAPGVAVGAIHRGNNKELGPKRIPMLSYGVLRHIPYEPDAIEEDPEMAHLKEIKPNRLSDGEYWTDLIEYLIHKGDEPLESVYSSSFTNLYKISINSNEKWVQWEAIYSSDATNKSFFKLHSPENNSAKKIGEIELDLQKLKNRAVKKQGHYELEVDVEIKVIDRNLYFEIFLAGKNGERIPEGYASFSMVAGFQPGTE